jgi:hypothetical protein
MKRRRSADVVVAVAALGSFAIARAATAGVADSAETAGVADASAVDGEDPEASVEAREAAVDLPATTPPPPIDDARSLLGAEAAVGIGAPLGWLGAAVVLRPIDVLDLDAGFGLGSQGFQTALGLRGRIPMESKLRLSVGGTYSWGTYARADRGHDVDVVGRARERGSRIRDEEAPDHPADEGNVVAQRAEAGRNRPKCSKLVGGSGHSRRLRSSFTASSRSRARPPRTASTRARSS